MQNNEHERRRIEEARRKFILDHFGPRYLQATLSNLKGFCGQDADGEKVLKWVNSRKNMLAMIGNPGTGKTYFCAGFISDTWGKYQSIRYWPEKKLFERLRETIENKGDYSKELEFMIDDEIVIFDDIGSSGFTDWRKEIIFNAIDIRYASMKPTIITSNLTRKELEENLHSRLCDRLFAHENTIIEMNASSLRKEGL